LTPEYFDAVEVAAATTVALKEATSHGKEKDGSSQLGERLEKTAQDRLAWIQFFCMLELTQLKHVQEDCSS
jgi:hypothetical protein